MSKILMDSSLMSNSKNMEGQKNAYQVLARRWRPQTFKDVIGQDIMVQVLTNAIRSNRLGHAFILTGERGVGKTSTARILARAINCVGRSEDEIDPCGKCEVCIDILEERHLDVLEMDAASHTSVDDIREIISGARYLPLSARYKVYIIDEVHMLSKSAFNALLKTLEEPPAHVKFIFATTEIHKVPITILSRCCKFDLKRISVEDIEKYLRYVVQKEGATASEGAFSLLARFADGSLRDAMSLLDQALNMSEEKDGITERQVRDMVGALESGDIVDLFDVCHQGDMKKTLSLAENFYKKGGDSSRLIKDLLEVSYILCQLKVNYDMDLGTRVQEEQERLRGLAQKLSMAVLQRTWQILSKGWEEIKTSPVSSMTTQMVLLRLGYIQGLPSLSSWPAIFENSEKLEHVKTQSAFSEKKKEEKARTLENKEQESATIFQENSQIAQDFSSLEEIADFLLEKKEIRLYTLLCQEAHLIDLEPGVITLRINPEASNFSTQLGRVLTDLTHKKWVVRVSQESGQPTLNEKKDAFEAVRFSEAGNNSLVQEVLKTFEGARLEKIIDEPMEETCKIFQK